MVIDKKILMKDFAVLNVKRIQNVRKTALCGCYFHITSFQSLIMQVTTFKCFYIQLSKNIDIFIPIHFRGTCKVSYPVIQSLIPKNYTYSKRLVIENKNKILVVPYTLHVFSHMQHW